MSPHPKSGVPTPRRKRPALGDYTTANWRLVVLSLMAVPIGGAGAGIAWILVRLIGFITNISFYHTVSFAFNFPSHETVGWMAFIPPIVGGLLIGLMARYGSEKIRGHGIPEAIEAILLNRSVIEPKVAVIKPVASAIAIGTGGPFGAEGPIIMTGGAFGSLFAQLFKLSAMERKTLMIAGASAGMAGIFATPVAATLIAVELLLFEWRPRSFIPVAIAAAAATIVREPLLGAGPLFAYHSALMPLAGLFICIPVGITAGLLSGLLTWLTYRFEDGFGKLPVHWMWWPAIGGVLIGIAAMIEPRALGVGYDVIRDLLAGNLVFSVVLALLIVKSLLWASTLGSGTSGGVLAPLLIMGGAMGALEARIIPVGEPTLWALVGMTAVLGGTMRSPFTCIVFALELTHDMNAVLPLTIATFVAAGCTVLMLKRSVLTEKISRRGHHVTREYSTDPFETMFVEDHMTRDVRTLAGNMTVGDAVKFFDEHMQLPPHADERDPESYKHGLPVVDDRLKLLGMLLRTDVGKLRSGNYLPTVRIADVTPKARATGYPDEPLSRVADRMAESDMDCVPIVDPQSGTLISLVTRHDVLRARAMALGEEHIRERIIDLHVHLPHWLRNLAPAHADAGKALHSDVRTVGQKPDAGTKRDASKRD
ncbi:MAG TPA: chloride channel protein [Gammaproteobacteria bacterium]|nr:chloride channel protein [Gammaproteobacteria bacterium]